MDSVHIACAFDRGMAIPALILAYSVKKFANPSRKTIFHILECEKGACPSYADYLLNSDHFELRYHFVHLDAFKNYDLSIAFVHSLATLARLAIPEIISDADRVLYLDCDIVVNHSIDALLDIDMKSFPIAACRDLMYAYCMKRGDTPHQNAARMLFKDIDSYFNAGVMLIDCCKWRDAGYFEALVKVLMESQVPLFYADQDALNIIFENNHLKLDPRWNSRASRYDLSEDEEIQRLSAFCADDPWIIHFMGKAKPWISFHEKTEFHRLYWDLAGESPFLSKLIALYEAGPLENTAYAVRKLPMVFLNRRVWEFLFTLSRTTEKVEAALQTKPILSTRLGTLGNKIHHQYLAAAEAAPD